LQAADILLYETTHVPVGEDQFQHIELARMIAHTFNVRFCGGDDPRDTAGEEGGDTEVLAAESESPTAADGAPFRLRLPRTVPPLCDLATTTGAASGTAGSACARIMSLRDGTRKMSKSDRADGARISLTDSDDAIADKVRRAKTDAQAGFSYDPAGRPDKSNLLAILAAVTGATPEALAGRYAHATATAFKADLTEALIARIAPLRADIARVRGDPAYVDAALPDGAAAARAIAARTMMRVRAAVGLPADIPPLPP